MGVSVCVCVYVYVCVYICLCAFFCCFVSLTHSLSFSLPPSEELKCAGVTCAPLPVPECPGDSVWTLSYTPPAGCCPTLPPHCTCGTCPSPPLCPAGHFVAWL